MRAGEKGKVGHAPDRAIHRPPMPQRYTSTGILQWVRTFMISLPSNIREPILVDLDVSPEA
jgi:hypothetical protein